MFEFGGKKYRITGAEEGQAEWVKWQKKKTDIERVRRIFAWRPWWVGNKFRLFTWFELRQRMQFVRYSGFDDGWSYQDYWKPWHIQWEDIEIL